VTCDIGKVPHFLFLSLPNLSEWFPEKEIAEKRSQIARLIQVIPFQ
jgi:hypothetical protein